MTDEPLVLGIETSCDETGIALVRGRTLLADLVSERLASGEPLPDRVELPEEGARESGAATADILRDRAQRGLLLLPARPLYLRRPDAVVPASMGGVT